MEQSVTETIPLPNRRIEKKAAQKISILVEDWKYKEELPVSKGLGEPLRDTHGEF